MQSTVEYQDYTNAGYRTHGTSPKATNTDVRGVGRLFGIGLAHKTKNLYTVRWEKLFWITAIATH